MPATPTNRGWINRVAAISRSKGAKKLKFGALTEVIITLCLLICPASLPGISEDRDVIEGELSPFLEVIGADFFHTIRQLNSPHTGSSSLFSAPNSLRVCNQSNQLWGLSRLYVLIYRELWHMDGSAEISKASHIRDPNCLENLLLFVWKCLRPPLIRGELIGSQEFPEQKEWNLEILPTPNSLRFRIKKTFAHPSISGVPNPAVIESNKTAHQTW